MDNIVLSRSRIVLPQSIRSHAIEIAQEGHQSLVKTEMLLREKIQYPCIDELSHFLINAFYVRLMDQISGPEPLQITHLCPLNHGIQQMWISVDLFLWDNTCL